MDCVIDKMYPDIKVERKNKEYAEILLQDYAGNVSELSAITLYSYQQFSTFEEYEEFAHIIEQISITEMVHLKLLGQTIKKLGVDPIFKIKSLNNSFIPWTGDYLNYNNNIVDIIKINIKSEQDAIDNYKSHKSVINDKYIKTLLDRIIEDEYKHIECFNKLLKKYQKV